MGPEFNEKLQWARYLQMEHNEARRKEIVRIAKIEEELKKEEEDKDVKEKYMNYNVEEESTNNDKRSLKDKFNDMFFAPITVIVFWTIVILLISYFRG